MYFHTTDKKPFILEKDLIVYKVNYDQESKNSIVMIQNFYMRVKNKNKDSFKSIYHNYFYEPYELNKTKLNLRDPSDYELHLMCREMSYRDAKSHMIVDNGFHAYLKKPKHIFEIFKSILSGNEYTVGRFKIPAGSKCFVNLKLNEIVSNQIIYTGQIETLPVLINK